MITRTLLRPTINNLLNFAINKKQLRYSTTVACKVTSNNNISRKSWREIPGPSSLPVVGPLLHFLPGGSLHNLKGLALTNKLYNTYGPIVRIDGVVGLLPTIYLFDAESTERVMRGENVRAPHRRALTVLHHYRLNGKYRKPGDLLGLITENGELWREFRTTVNPWLLNPKTIKLYEHTLEEVASDMVERIKLLRDENNMIKLNFDNEIKLWAFESICTIALGCRVGCLSNLSDNDPKKQFLKTVMDLVAIMEDLEFKPNLWRYISTPKYKKGKELYEQLEDFNRYFINKAKENFKNKSEIDDEKSILEKLLEIDENIACVMASEMLLAGFDTMSNATLATFYLLASNPDVQHKLRLEITSESNSKPYLKACIKESLRIMPPLSMNGRTTTKEYDIYGYQIPINMQVVFGHHNMSLDEKNFPRPNEFIPERWLDDRNKNANNFAYSPFSFGIRSCVGRRIALLELEIFVAKVIENFDIKWTGPPPNISYRITNQIIEPFHFIFNDIKK